MKPFSSEEIMMANVSTNTSGDSLDELATGLQKWMVEEMHFEMRGRHAISAVPVVDDFKWYVSLNPAVYESSLLCT